MINFFKKNFVFGIGILQAIIILGSFLSGNKLLILIATDWSKYLWLIVFLIWLKDENYKFIYYFFFFLSIKFLQVIFQKLLYSILQQFIFNKLSLALVVTFLTILGAIISQFLYNIFRNMSYKKHKDNLSL